MMHIRAWDTLSMYPSVWETQDDMLLLSESGDAQTREPAHRTGDSGVYWSLESDLAALHHRED